jgi:hypothetical protein
VRSGISALVVLMIISLSVWLLRRRAIEETTPDTAPEQEEGAEAMSALRASLCSTGGRLTMHFGALWR